MTLIKADLITVRETITNEINLIEKTLMTEAEKGRRLFFLFQKELMPGPQGKILDSKNLREAGRIKRMYSLPVKVTITAVCYSLVLS